MKKENEYTYEQAFKELQEIVQEIESGDIDIDQLSEAIKQASVLVKVCETKLKATEQEVQVLLESLNNTNTELPF